MRHGDTFFPDQQRGSIFIVKKEKWKSNFGVGVVMLDEGVVDSSVDFSAKS